MTYMIDVGSADLHEHQLSVGEGQKSVLKGLELQSTHANALPLHKNIVKYYMFLPTHVLHTSWRTRKAEHKDHIHERY